MCSHPVERTRRDWISLDRETDRVITVLSAGFQTTVQDCGRPGLRKFGVAPGGALDSISLRLANLLVRNSEGAAGLEISSGRIGLQIDNNRLIAWAGGDFEVRIEGNLVPILHCARVSASEDIEIDRKSTRLNSSHVEISYAVFSLKKQI